MAKKLVANDFWLVVNGDSASCKSIACMQAASQKIIHTCAMPIYTVHFDLKYLKRLPF